MTIAARLRVASLGLCAAAAVGGCSSVSDDAQNVSLEALATRVPAPADYVAPTWTVSCTHLFRSLPPSPLPAPREMPSNSYMRKIFERGRLIVGVDQNTLGLGYFNPKTRKMQGLDIDLVRRIAAAIFGDDRHIQFKAIATGQRESVIALQDVDLVASAFSINCNRLRRMYFSSVYYRARQRLLVLRGSAARSLADLRGQRVCATKGSTSIENLEGTGVVAYPVELRPDCLVELQKGKVAAITADDSILVGFIKQDPQTMLVGPCINVERYGLAINRHHPEFVRFVNAVLKRIGSDGLEKIRRRWLGALKAPTRSEIARCDRSGGRTGRAATNAAPDG